LDIRAIITDFYVHQPILFSPGESSQRTPVRIQYPGAWHHVTNRGRRKEDVF